MVEHSPRRRRKPIDRPAGAELRAPGSPLFTGNAIISHNTGMKVETRPVDEPVRAIGGTR
jgi:hypothetical protein